MRLRRIACVCLCASLHSGSREFRNAIRFGPPFARLGVSAAPSRGPCPAAFCFSPRRQAQRPTLGQPLREGSCALRAVAGLAGVPLERLLAHLCNFPCIEVAERGRGRPPHDPSLWCRPVCVFSAFGAQVHALNLLRSLIAASAPVAGADTREAAALADTAVARWKRNLSSYPEESKGSPGAGKTPSCGQTNGLQPKEGDVDEADIQGTHAPLAIMALTVAIKATASREFPVRSSANSLLVAATKRLAGTDDEVRKFKRHTVAPPIKLLKRRKL